MGFNRRAYYFDGRVVMYGNTNQENFSHIEGYEDHGQEMLFFWDADQKLTGVVINVACPAQETEGLLKVSADFWHEVRQEIRAKYGKKIFIFPQCGAAGDQSPHLLWQKQAEDIMRQRKGLSRRQEIARRIAQAVDEVFPYTKKDTKSNVVFIHKVAGIHLPTREPPDLLVSAERRAVAGPFYTCDSVKPAEVHV